MRGALLVVDSTRGALVTGTFIGLCHAQVGEGDAARLVMGVLVGGAVWHGVSAERLWNDAMERWSASGMMPWRDRWNARWRNVCYKQNTPNGVFACQWTTTKDGQGHPRTTRVSQRTYKDFR